MQQHRRNIIKNSTKKRLQSLKSLLKKFAFMFIVTGFFTSSGVGLAVFFTDIGLEVNGAIALSITVVSFFLIMPTVEPLYNFFIKE